MFRKLVGVVLVLVAAGLVTAQPKDKAGKDPVPKVKGTIVKVDAAKMLLTVKTADGKTVELPVDKEVKFVGPRGGKATIKDARLQPGVELGLVMDGKVLKEVHIPVISSKKPKDKGKEVDAKTDKPADKAKKDKKPAKDKN